MKYPRTYHLPWSPGATSDDKRLQDGWFDFYRGKEVVFTEKLDGENTAITHYDVYARSHGAPTRSPWSRNLWDTSDGLYWKVNNFIGPNETVYGENLYGEGDYGGGTVSITGGKIVKNGTKTPSGMPADYIEFYVSFSDDLILEQYLPEGTRYKVTGFRYTGFVEDE